MMRIGRSFALALLLSAGLAQSSERAQSPSAIIVPASSTLQGVAGTGTAITYTISGNAVQGTAETPVLAQGQLPTSAGVLYTAAAGSPVSVASITLANATSSAVSGVKIFLGGSAAANQISGSLTVPANGTCTNSGGVAWSCIDANGALQTSSGGGTTYFAGTGLHVVGTTFILDTPIPCASQPPLTTDVTTSGCVATLATVNSNVGSFGSASQVATFTVNGKGLITAASNTPIAITESQVTNLVSDLALKAPLASPALTGTPTAPTAAPGTNTTQLATTAYATAADTALAATLQPLDATLTALAAQNWAANALPIGTGADTLAQTSFAANTFPARASTGNLVAKTITDFGLSQVDDVDATAGRATLALGTAATQNTGTSGANIPFLNGTNTWGAVNTFSSAPVMSGASITAATIPAASLVSTITAGGPTGSSSVVPVITYNASGQLTAVTTASITTSSIGGGTVATKNVGVSVDDPGTGALEYLIKPQTLVTGASKAWAASDYYKSQKRSNSGSAMTDTLPCGTVAGQSMLLNNVDVSAADTLTVAGCTFTSATGVAGGTTFTLNYGRRSRFVWNAVVGAWDIEVNSNNVLKNVGTVTVGNIPIYSTLTNGTEVSPFTGTGYVKATGGSAITASATVPNTDVSGLGTLSTQNGTFSGTSSGTNSGDVTVTNAGTSSNAAGASIAGQAITLQTASASFPGLMTAAHSAFVTAYKDVTVVLVTANQWANIACDGTTDDAANWNTITANAPARSVLLMPPCTSVIKSAITTAKHFTFHGAGIDKSIIQSNVNAADFITLGDWYTNIEGISFIGLNTTATEAKALSAVATTLNVAVTAGFPTSGGFYVHCGAAGYILAAYTSINSGTQFGGVTVGTGCTTTNGGALTVKTGGQAVDANTMNHVFLREVEFRYVYDGFRSDGTICGILDSFIFQEVNFGIEFNGTNVNSIVHNVTADGIPAAVAHIEVKQAGSLLISDDDLIRAQSNMRLNPTSPNGVFGVYAVNTYFDTATSVSGTANSGNGVLLQGTGNIQRIKFINSWLSSATHSGLWANSTSSVLPTDIEVSGNNIYSNGVDGLQLDTVQDFIVSGNQISGNATAGIALLPGASAVTNGSINNNQIGPAGGIGANGTGLVVGAGTYGNMSVVNNDISGNTTASQTGLPATVTAPNLAVIGQNLGMFACPPPIAPALSLPITTTNQAGTSCVMRPGARIGSWARITVDISHTATIATLTPKLVYGPLNTTADPSLLTITPAAGTAAVGSGSFVWEFKVVSATTAMVTYKFTNGNNAATGIGGVSSAFMTTAPVAIANINTLGYLGAYFTTGAASGNTIQNVSYEYGQ